MDEQSDVDFIQFIEDTLIPDLHQSGTHATAEDFERLLDIIRTEERWLTIKEAGLVRE